MPAAAWTAQRADKHSALQVFRDATQAEIGKRYLTHAQLHRLAVASGRVRSFVLVLGYTGLRFGEAAALRVGDVDMKARRIRVKRSVTFVTKQGLVEGADEESQRLLSASPRKLLRTICLRFRPSGRCGRAKIAI